MESLKKEITALYERWIAGWNAHDSAKMASTLAEGAPVIGFDGTLMTGPDEVRDVIGEIFKHHKTGEYVCMIRDVKPLGDGVAMLRADVGMVARGQKQVNPAVNACQIMVAAKSGNEWKIASFQNTPAAFHGRPELVLQMTRDLQARFEQQ